MNSGDTLKLSLRNSPSVMIVSASRCLPGVTGVIGRCVEPETSLVISAPPTYFAASPIAWPNCVKPVRKRLRNTE